jgi:hypothetical protein
MLDDRGMEVRFPVGARDSLLHNVHTGCGAHPASYTMGTGACFHGVKRPGPEAVSSAEVKSGEAIPPVLHTSWRLGV